MTQEKTRCCWCIPLGVAMLMAFLFTIVELIFAAIVGAKIKELINSVTGTFVVLMVVKSAPILSFFIMGYRKEDLCVRKTNFYIFAYSQIIEAIIYAVIIYLKVLGTDHVVLLKSFLTVYAILVLFKAIFGWNTYKYWMRLENSELT